MVAFLVTSEICFSFDIAQQLWLPCKPSRHPGEDFLSKRESPWEAASVAASEFPALCPVRCCAFFTRLHPGPCTKGRGKGEVHGELLPPSGSIPHNTFPSRLFPDEEIESEWAYGEQTEMWLEKSFLPFGGGLQGTSVGLRKCPFASPRL